MTNEKCPRCGIDTPSDRRILMPRSNNAWICDRITCAGNRDDSPSMTEFGPEKGMLIHGNPKRVPGNPHVAYEITVCGIDSSMATALLQACERDGIGFLSAYLDRGAAIQLAQSILYSLGVNFVVKGE